MRLRIFRLLSIFVLSLVTCLLFLGRARAATVKVYFGGPTEVGVGSEFNLDILIDSDVSLNAYALGFTYPADVLQIVNFDDSNSIINVWQTRPTLYQGGTAALQGGSLKSFSGAGGNIISVRFKVLKSGVAEFSIIKPTVYLADGRGTPLTPLVGSFSVNLSSSSLPPTGTLENSDTEPPAIQSLAIISDPLNAGNKLLSFQVQDAVSGVSSIAVRFRSGFFWSDWQQVQNPAVLPAGAWTVDFKVSDIAGNTAERLIYDWENMLYRVMLPLLAILASIGLIWGVVHRFSKSRRIGVL